MGLTERHWFEDEEPELTERQLENAVEEQKAAYKRGYQKGYSDCCKEKEAEIRQLRLALDIAKGTCKVIKVEGR